MKVSRFVHVLAAFALVWLGSCASGPRYSEIADRIPAVPEGQGRVYFFRDSFLGAAVTADIHLNGEVVGRSVNGGFFFVDREPGTYEVACATEVERKLSFTLSPAETRYVRTYVQMGLFIGRVHAELLDGEAGAAALADLHYVGAETALSSEPAAATNGHAPPEPAHP